jgi:site-specific DNA recombinase
MNKVRCAIYTRKSSDEGLDQAFNSLDAQREACEAYIMSQKHEGWKVVSTRYDDGGASGGNLQRTALQDLLAEIHAGRIDMIVVYKIDRLTRSLSDFAKLVDRLDEAGASFVSVTQQFNTSTSMGRLTLNVLLSFAQFEREVTAERIRDKIAASKKKGMWMGGLVPLGYDRTDKGLEVIPAEAQTVRALFEGYLSVGSVRELKAYASKNGLVSKVRKSSDGSIMPGQTFSRGALYHLLANPIYIGKIKHKDKIYDGLHDAIIDEALWTKVQDRLARQRVTRKTRSNTINASPLAGKVLDQEGRALTPSHANKAGKRYRYYISKHTKTDTGETWRLSAAGLEDAILQGLNADRELTLQAQRHGITVTLENVRSVRVERARLDIQVDIKSGSKPHTITVPYQLRRRGIEMKMVLQNQPPAKPDIILIKRILKALNWIERLKAGDTISKIAEDENITPSHITHHLDLGFVSPKVLNAILAGKQKPELTTRKISKLKISPVWEEQDAIFFD